MKYLTVAEYAKAERISLAAAYKRANENRCQVERKFGRILIKVKEEKV